MRGFLIIAIVVMLASCGGGGNHSAPVVNVKGYKQKSIRLANGLGVVSIYLPPELDTFYTFINFGEYHCAEVKLHRFFSKKYGCAPSPSVDFDYSDMPDSAYQFSIVQTYNKDCEQFINIDEGMMKNIEDMYTNLNKYIAGNRKYTMKEINGNKFIISQLNTKLNNLNLEEVEGFTQADGRMVKFIFQCYSPDVDDFTDRMLASLNTIQISPDEKGK